MSEGLTVHPSPVQTPNKLRNDCRPSILLHGSCQGVVAGAEDSGILRGVSLYNPSGSSCAIVGPSGYSEICIHHCTGLTSSPHQSRRGAYFSTRALIKSFAGAEDRGI